MVTITPFTHPLIWRAIVASASISTLFALRFTCSEVRKIVDSELYAHLSARGRYQVRVQSGWIHGEFQRGFFLAPRWDGQVRVRVPKINSEKGEVMRRCCSILEVDVHIRDDQVKYLSSQLAPQVLILTPMRVKPPLRKEDVDALYYFSPVTYLSAPVTVFHNDVCNAAALAMDHCQVRSVIYSDITHRFVLHQHLSDDREMFLPLAAGSRLREVDVYFSQEGELGNCRAVAEALKWYIYRLIRALRGVSITLVGLKGLAWDANLGNDDLSFSETSDPPAEPIDCFAKRLGGEGVELRTIEEHRAVIGEKRWSLEGTDYL